MAAVRMDSKESLRIFGIFTGIIAFLFLVDLGFIRLAERKWSYGLKDTVSRILEEKHPEKWNVLENVQIPNPFSTSSAVFEIQNRENGKKGYAVIIRTTTIFGAYPAVFIYGKDTGAEFTGYACVTGRVKRILEEDSANIRINYWTGRIRDIITSVQRNEE